MTAEWPTSTDVRFYLGAIRSNGGGADFYRRDTENGAGEYQRFFRQALSRLGPDASNFFSFLSLYTQKDRQAEVFAGLGLRLVKKVISSGQEPEDLAILEWVKDYFPADRNSRAIQKYALRTTCFWAAALHKIFPEEPLSIRPKDKRIFAVAEGQAFLALKRATVVLAMAREIASNGPTLDNLGISFIQQELIVRAMMGLRIGVRGGLTKRESHSLAILRSHIPSDPGVYLEKLRAGFLFSKLPPNIGVEALTGIINEMVAYFTGCESAGKAEEIKSMARARVDALCWLRHLPDEEKKDLLLTLGKQRKHPSLQKALAGKTYSAAFARGRRYAVRKGRALVDVAGPISEMILEHLEGRPVERIMNPPEPNLEEVKILVEKADQNILKNGALLSGSVRGSFEKVKSRLNRSGFFLTKREILMLLRVGSIGPFDSALFFETFKRIFDEDIYCFGEGSERGAFKD